MHEIIFDNSFEVEKTKEYLLSIQVSLDGFSFSVIHSPEKRMLAFCSNPLKISNVDFLDRRFREWIESMEILQKEFKEVKIVFNTEKFTIVPEKYYDPHSKENILELLFEINENAIVEENMVDELNARLLFPLPAALKEEVTKHFNEFHLVHPVKVMFENLPLDDNKSRLVLFFSDKFFNALLFTESKLLLANSFYFSHENDAVFYVLSLLTQMKIKPNTVHLYLSGNVNAGSAIPAQLQKHVSTVQFLERRQSVQINENVFGQLNNTHILLLT